MTMRKSMKRTVIMTALFVPAIIFIFHSLGLLTESLCPEQGGHSQMEFLIKQNIVAREFTKNRLSGLEKVDLDSQPVNRRLKQRQGPNPTKSGWKQNGYVRTTQDVTKGNNRPRNNKDHNLFSNISLDSLVHVTENEGLNYSEFAKWTKSYLGANRKQLFFMPTFYEKSPRLCDDRPDLVILMPSPADHLFSRELIRQTWASSIYNISEWPGREIVLKTKLVFIIGTEGLSNGSKIALKKEALVYSDIVAADFVDSYHNLTLKMLVGLNWVALYCNHVKFVLKCDLDTFINLPLIARLLIHVADSVPRFILGHKHRFVLPPVVRSGKWAVNDSDYPFPYFPPYHIGHSYAISGGLIPKMAETARYFPVIPIEDAHITGILARVLKVPRIHFSAFASVDKPILNCQIVYNKEVSMTRMSLDRILLVWRYILTGSCPETQPPDQTDKFIDAQLENWCQKCQQLSAPLSNMTKSGQNLTLIEKMEIK